MTLTLFAANKKSVQWCGVYLSIWVLHSRTMYPHHHPSLAKKGLVGSWLQLHTSIGPQCTMRRPPLQSVNRTIYQNVYLAPHFFLAPLFQMTNICIGQCFADVPHSPELFWWRHMRCQVANQTKVIMIENCHQQITSTGATCTAGAKAKDPPTSSS